MFALRRSSLAAALFALSAVTAFATYLEGVLLRGRLAEKKCFYAPGETMTFELKLDCVKELPEGCTIHWDRWGDDGQTTNGSIAATAADATYKVETSLAVPGFVWLKATLRGPDGAIVSCASNGNCRVVQFDGGAGVEPQKLQSVPEPEDFDAFWAAQRKSLDSVPITVEKKELASLHPDQFKLFAVSIACPGPRPVTGYLVVPADFGSGKKYSARISFQGYGTGVQQPPQNGFHSIWLSINAHGYELGREPAYYEEFFKGIRTEKYSYAFNPEENKDPNTAYFRWMALRVMRALQYLKSIPEWNGKELTAVGGSQGGLQTIWAAGLDPDVTCADASIPWCCDLGGQSTFGRHHGAWRIPYVRGLDYFDPVNIAKRIPASCNFAISRAGLGDYCCPPSGVAVLYNNIRAPKEICWVQGSTHGFVPSPPTQSWRFAETNAPVVATPAPSSDPTPVTTTPNKGLAK